MRAVFAFLIGLTILLNPLSSTAKSFNPQDALFAIKVELLPKTWSFFGSHVTCEQTHMNPSGSAYFRVNQDGDIFGVESRDLLDLVPLTPIRKCRAVYILGVCRATCIRKEFWTVNAKVDGEGIVRKTSTGEDMMDIPLLIRDYRLKTVTTCTNCCPQCIALPPHIDHGKPKRWWKMAVYNFPIKNGWSQTHGRFKYTLRIIDIDSDGYEQEKSEYSEKESELKESDCRKQFEKCKQGVDLLLDDDAKAEKKLAECFKEKHVSNRCDTRQIIDCMHGMFYKPESLDTSKCEAFNMCKERLPSDLKEKMDECINQIMEDHLKDLKECSKEYEECLE